MKRRKEGRKTRSGQEFIRTERNCDRGSRILPPPPDVRRVVIKDEEGSNFAVPEWFQVDVPVVNETFRLDMNTVSLPPVRVQEVVSSGNTTLIGDQIAASFHQHDSKWLVQAADRATVGSVIEGINTGSITLDRRYIFISIGHNQLDAVHRGSVKPMFNALISLIRQKNEAAKIFVVGLLPKPLLNDVAKPQIVKFNRILAETVSRIKKNDHRVLFMPAHLEFTFEGQPKTQMFERDLVHLSKIGKQMFKRTLFDLAGFTVNA